MFQQEEMSYESQGTTYGYAGDTRYEEASPSSAAGQKLIPEASGQAPTVGQRLVLALVSLGMLMGMTTLLTIMAVKAGIFPFLFVLTLFTAAVVSINVVFHQRAS
jgi:hypothetical protein